VKVLINNAELDIKPEIHDEESPDDNIIRESDLKHFFRFCPYAQYLHTEEGRTKIPWVTAVIQSIFFNGKRKKKLFNVRDPKTGYLFSSGNMKEKEKINERRAGPNSRHVEHMNQDELREYMPFSSAESFGKTLRHIFNRHAEKQSYAKHKIVWSFFSEYKRITEKGDFIAGKAADEIRIAGKNYYNFILENGAPFMNFLDVDEIFEFEGQKFSTKFPEICIRKYTAENFQEIMAEDPFRHMRDYIIFLDDPDLFKFKEEKSHYRFGTKSLATLRLLGLHSKISELRNGYRYKVRADNTIANSYNGNPIYIDPTTTYRHICLLGDKDNGHKPIITEMRMSDKDLDPLKILIEIYNEAMINENFDPVTKNCGVCPYNILGLDGKPECEYHDPMRHPAVPLEYLIDDLFSFNADEIPFDDDIEPDKNVKIFTGNVKKINSGEKEVAKFKLYFTKKSDCYEVESKYSSFVHGTRSRYNTSFEDKMIKGIDEWLQDFANKEGVETVHRIDFDRNFRFAGYTKTKELLGELGYFSQEDRIEEQFDFFKQNINPKNQFTEKRYYPVKNIS